jgi:hypothetical protein
MRCRPYRSTALGFREGHHSTSSRHGTVGTRVAAVSGIRCMADSLKASADPVDLGAHPAAAGRSRMPARCPGKACGVGARLASIQRTGFPGDLASSERHDLLPRRPHAGDRDATSDSPDRRRRTRFASPTSGNPLCAQVMADLRAPLGCPVSSGEPIIRNAGGWAGKHTKRVMFIPGAFWCCGLWQEVPTAEAWGCE